MLRNSESSFDRVVERRRKLRATLPDRIADHELLRPIADGSYGDVWLVRNELTGAYRALKILWRQAFETRKPYEREFDAIRRFEPISRSHPGFVHVLQTGKLQQGFYYIMELADAVGGRLPVDPATYRPKTLAGARHRRLNVEEVINIGISLAESLSRLHAAGLIHRDIKPSNVIFVGGAPKLADIGLVAVASEANSLVGTDGFIAPEGPTGPRADIYSLGKLLYEIATGRDRLDFPALPEQVTNDHNLLLELNLIMVKACHPDPSQRYGSAQAMRAELQFLIQGRSIKRVRQLERALRWTKAAFATTCMVGIIGFSMFQAGEARRKAALQLSERRIATIIAQGDERTRRGDFLAGLHYYSRAAVLDANDSKEHRLRLGSTLTYSPKWFALQKSESQVACFSEQANLLGTIRSGRIHLYDIGSNAPVREFSFGATFMAMDPSGEMIAAANSNKVTLISLRDGHEESIELPDPVSHISLARSKSVAVSLTNGMVHIFPGNRQLPPENGKVYKAILSPSGNLLCILKNSGEVRILNTATLALLSFRAAHTSLPYNAVFSEDETAIITCSFDRTAICWNIEGGKRIGFPMEHDDGILYVAISPDGSIVATGSMDRTVRLWRAPNFAPARENHVLYHPERVLWVKFLSNTSLIAHCHDGTTWRWTIDANPVLPIEEPRTFDLPPRDQAVGESSQLSVLNNVVSGHIRGNRFAATLDGPVESVSLAIAPDENLVAIGTCDSGRAAHNVRLYDAKGGLTGRRMSHRDGITYVTFSNSGELIGSCSEDFTARVWDRSGAPVTPALRHRNQVRWLAFSDNDEWIATASYDETVRLWSIRSGIPITVPLKVDNIVDYVCFRGEAELFIANSRRNYTLPLPTFTGEPNALLSATPPPHDSDEF